MTDSYLITEKTRDAKAKKQIKASITILKIGEINLSVANALSTGLSFGYSDCTS